MAFCKYCGTQLEENQLCNCPQAVAANTSKEPVAPNQELTPTPEVNSTAVVPDYGKMVGNLFNQTINTYINVLKKPFTEGSRYVQEGNNSVAYVLIILQSILFGILAAIYAGNINKSFDNDYLTIIEVSGAKWFFLSLLASIAMVILFAGLFIAMYKLNKSSATFMNTLRLATLKTIPAIPAILLSILLSLFGSWLALAVLLLIPVLGVIFMMQGMHGIQDISENKRGYIFMLVFLVATVIFCFVGYKGIFSTLQALVNSMVGNIFSSF